MTCLILMMSYSSQDASLSLLLSDLALAVAALSFNQWFTRISNRDFKLVGVLLLDRTSSTYPFTGHICYFCSLSRGVYLVNWLV